jgi:uncharacterized protein YkwD
MIRVALAALFLFGLAALAQEKKDKPAKVELNADLKAMLKLVNESRAKEKLEPLSLDPLLCKAAQVHNDNMIKQEKMSHILDGKRVGDRVTAAGYDYRVVAENLALAEGEPKDPAPDVADIHKGWMESKGHRANILNGKFTQIGMAMGRCKKGNYYYTHVFAAPRK